MKPENEVDEVEKKWDQLLDDLDSLGYLEENWNGEGAKKINPDSIKHAKNFVMLCRNIKENHED